MNNLQAAQLQAASSGQDIADIDNFMLFHQYFQQLQQPLKDVTTSTFSRSSFQEPLLLRGIYFAGKLDQDIAFVDDLMAQKVFAESNLTWPVEKSRFSTQKTLRRFQFYSLATGVAMLLLLIIDSTRLQQHSQETQQVLHELRQLKADCSDQGMGSYRLLTGLSEIGQRPFFLSLPISWLGDQMRQEQTMLYVINQKICN